VDEKVSDAPLPLDIQKSHSFNFVRCDPNDADIQYIKAYYGLSDSFDTLQLVSSDQAMNKISFVSKELSEYLYTDCFSHSLNLINLGVPLFQRNHSKFAGQECIFRVCQEGILNIVLHMSKRIVKTKNLEVFKQLISKRYNGIYSLLHEEPEVAKAVDELHPGCFVFVVELPDGNIEALAMHKFEYALSSMIGRESAFSF